MSDYKNFDAVIVQFCFLFLNVFLMRFLPCGIGFLVSFLCLAFGSTEGNSQHHVSLLLRTFLLKIHIAGDEVNIMIAEGVGSHVIQRLKTGAHDTVFSVVCDTRNKDCVTFSFQCGYMTEK